MNKKHYLMAKEIKNKIHTNTDGNVYQYIHFIISLDEINEIMNYNIRRIFDSQKTHDLYSTGNDIGYAISQSVDNLCEK